jgi:hypothetical protein
MVDTMTKVKVHNNVCISLALKDTQDIVGNLIDVDIPYNLNEFNFLKLFYKNCNEKIEAHLKAMHITPGSKRYIEANYILIYKIHHMARNEKITQKDLFLKIINESYPKGTVLSMRKNLSDLIEQSSNKHEDLLEKELCINLSEYKLGKPTPEEYISIISKKIIKDKDNIIVPIDNHGLKNYYDNLIK